MAAATTTRYASANSRASSGSRRGRRGRSCRSAGVERADQVELLGAVEGLLQQGAEQGGGDEQEQVAADGERPPARERRHGEPDQAVVDGQDDARGDDARLAQLSSR